MYSRDRNLRDRGVVKKNETETRDMKNCQLAEMSSISQKMINNISGHWFCPNFMDFCHHF